MQFLIDEHGTVSITVPSWPQLRLTGLQPSLVVDGDDAQWTGIRPISKTQKAQLHNLMEKYMHDFSEYDGEDVD